MQSADIIFIKTVSGGNFMNFKKASSRMALIYSAVYGVLLVAEIILGVILVIFQEFNQTTLAIILSIVPLYLIGFPLAVFLFKRFPDCSGITEKENMSALQFVKCFITAYAFMNIGSIISSFIQVMLSAMSQTDITDPASELIMGDAPKILLFISTVIIAPIGEELLFRYLPYKKISGYGNMEYVLLTSLCFSFFHMNFFQGIYAFLIGLVLGMVFLKTRKLIYCIMIHMLANFVGGILAPLSLNNVIFGAVFSICMLSATVAGIFIFVSYIKKTDKQPLKEMALVSKKDMLVNLGMIVFFIIFIISSVVSMFM